MELSLIACFKCHMITKKELKFLKKILNNKSLFFACENLVLTSKKDIIRIEKDLECKKKFLINV